MNAKRSTGTARYTEFGIRRVDRCCILSKILGARSLEIVPTVESHFLEVQCHQQRIQ